MVDWRNFAVGHHIAEVQLVCICSEASRARFEPLLWDLGLHHVTLQGRAFDTSRPISPPARELFSEAQKAIRLRDIVLLVAPGAVLVNLNGVAESVREVEEEKRNVFIAPGPQPVALPTAALFSAEMQMAHGLMIVAADAWAIRVRHSFFSRQSYHRWGDGGLLRGLDPSGKAINYDVRWLIGCLACAVEERQRIVRLQTVDWARQDGGD